MEVKVPCCFSLFKYLTLTRIVTNICLFREHEVQGARLTINNLRREDFGEYICTAMNQYGTQTAIMELLYGGTSLMYILPWR